MNIPSLILAVSLACACAGGAEAGGASDGRRPAPVAASPSATATATTSSAARGTARAAATGGSAVSGVTVVNTAPGTPGNVSGSGTASRSVPDLLAPALPGGGACTVGASSGISLPGFGLIGGGSWEGKGCERRQLAALLANMGQTEAAIEVLCANDDVRDAMKRVGAPCAADRALPGAPIAVASARPLEAPTVPDWCYTASAAERRGRPACRQGGGR